LGVKIGEYGLNKRYNKLHSLVLWGGIGAGHYYHLDINGDFGVFVTNQVKEAIRVRQERRKENGRRAVVKSLHERGVEITDQLSGLDENDLIGLIGEIVTNDFVVSLDIEPILPKWQYTGTSKSSGIDFVGREKLGHMWELTLYEAKHLHDEAKNAQTECYTLIRAKFRIGIDEFEDEKTKLNLANVLIQLGKFIRFGEANKSDTSLAKKHKDFISSSLKNDRYRANVVALVDAKYCSETTFEQSVSQISSPLEVGKNHLVRLNLIKAEYLEKTTNKVCESFVGAV
jgi:hypothetical protein